MLLVPKYNHVFGDDNNGNSSNSDSSGDISSDDDFEQENTVTNIHDIDQ